MTLEQVIADYLKELTNDIFPFTVIPKELAELAWDMDVPIGKINYCRRCGAVKQEEK